MDVNEIIKQKYFWVLNNVGDIVGIIKVLSDEVNSWNAIKSVSYVIKTDEHGDQVIKKMERFHYVSQLWSNRSFYTSLAANKSDYDEIVKQYNNTKYLLMHAL